MKVCQVLASDGNGGLEKHTIELSRGLQAKGIDITVIAPKKYKDDFKNMNFIEMDLTKGRSNVFTLWKLFRILKKEKFDIIHAQANKATDMIIKLKPFLKSKIVATLHNFKKNLKPFLKANAVITVSDRIGEKLNIDKKETIYNGIEIADNIDIDLHKHFNIPTDKFIICGVGRLVEAKGFDMLIESMQYMDHNIVLLLIGDGPDREKLEKLSKKLNIDNRILFAGNIENKFTKSMMKSSDLLVISSRREGFSYVFAESLLLGTPIVSTDVADIKKFIGPEYIIPFGDYNALAKKLEDVKNNYAEVEQDFIPIFQKAVHEFTVENMVNQTIKVYANVMGFSMMNIEEEHN